MEYQMMTRPSLKSLDVLLATWFGSGYLKPAPGTWGSLFSLPLAILLGIAFPVIGPLIGGLILFFIGLWASKGYMDKTKTHDPGSIVIDETCGLCFAMVAAPHAYWHFLVIFVLFRFFDIVKPFPIGYLDKNIKGALGVMLDDVIAGFFSAFTFLLLQYLLF